MSDNWEPDDLDLEEEPEAPRLSLRERRMKVRAEARGNWYLVTGLLLGLVIGLLFSWVLSPVKYLDTDPASLAPSYKDTYRRAIALSYSVDHNLLRARAREKLIDGENPVQALAAQAQRLMGENQFPEDARALAVLAADLARNSIQNTGSAPTKQVETEKANPTFPAGGATQPTNQDAVVAIQTPTLPPPLPTATRTLIATFTPRPTATPLRFLDSPFTLKSNQELCESSAKPGLLQIEVIDANGKPVPGVRITATWQNGQDTFYTGLVPEIDPGYANFVMTPGVVYSLVVGDASKPVNGLSIPPCSGGVKVIFQQGI